MLTLLKKIIKPLADWLLKDYVLMPKSQAEMGVFVDKAKNLILPKGKYKIVCREESRTDANGTVGMLVVDNSSESYDRLWGDKRNVEEYLAESRKNFYEAVSILCKMHINGRIMDVGCGSGDFLNIVRENGFDGEINGMDFSKMSIKRCKELMPSGKFSVEDIYMMGYRDNAFDTVICMETLEHLEKPEVALKEIRRICKKDGVIIITVPNGDYDDYVGHLNFWDEAAFMAFLGDIEVIDFQYIDGKKAMMFVLRN